MAAAVEGAVARVKHGDGQQHVRRRLAPDGRRLTDGDRHGVRKKFCPQCAHGLVRLVGHDGKLAPLRVQLPQQRVNAEVGGGLDAAVGGIVGVILCQQRLKECAVRSGGYGQLHQPPRSVAERGAHLLPRTFRQAVAGERAVHGGGQVGERVEQRAVEVEKYGCIAHIMSLLCYGTLITHFAYGVNKKTS